MSAADHINWVPTNAGFPAENQNVTWISPVGEQIDGAFTYTRRGLPVWVYVDERTCSPKVTDYVPAFWRER